MEVLCSLVFHPPFQILDKVTKWSVVSSSKPGLFAPFMSRSLIFLHTLHTNFLSHYFTPEDKLWIKTAVLYCTLPKSAISRNMVIYVLQWEWCKIDTREHQHLFCCCKTPFFLPYSHIYVHPPFLCPGFKEFIHVPFKEVVWYALHFQDTFGIHPQAKCSKCKKESHFHYEILWGEGTWFSEAWGHTEPICWHAVVGHSGCH